MQQPFWQAEIPSALRSVNTLRSRLWKKDFYSFTLLREAPLQTAHRLFAEIRPWPAPTSSPNEDPYFSKR